MEKASETGTANEYYANVSYYVEGGEALLVVIDTTGKWNNGTKDVTVKQSEATDPTTAQVATATTSSGSLTVASSPINITNGKAITLTGYSGTKNKFDVNLAAASSTSATMTLEGNILKNGPVIATGNKADIEVTGEGNITGKIVITGDITQTDLPYGKKSGLAEAIEILKDIPEIGMVHLTHKDVVRHELVQTIVKAYDAYYHREAEGQRP